MMGSERTPGDHRIEETQVAADRHIAELEDVVACAMVRMLRSWERLDASLRLDLVGVLARIARHYVQRDGELPRWVHEFLWEIALRQRQLEYGRPRANE